MKKSNFSPRNQYYNTTSRSRFSSRSSRRLQSQQGGSVSNSRNRFYNRIEKACTTFSSNDISKEVFLYRKEIQKLEKEALKKDKVIFELKQSSNHNRQIESQLVEVYRVLYMYEGKISQYEKQLKKLEKAISTQVPTDITNQVEELLESYRVENSELSAQLQERNRQIIDLQNKMKKLQNKYFNTVWKLSSTKREIANPLKKRFPNLRNTITINQTPLLEKEKALKFKSKTNNIGSQNEYQIIRQPVVKDNEPVLNFKKVQPPQLDTRMPNNSANANDYRNSNSATSTPVHLFSRSNTNNIINNSNRTLVSGTFTPQTQQSRNQHSHQKSVTPQQQLQGSINQQKVQTSSNYHRYIGNIPPQTSYHHSGQQSQTPYSNNIKPQSNYISQAQKQSYRTTGQPLYGSVPSSQQQVSNPNINSQMTVSNATNTRRIQYKQIRSQSPKRQLTGGMATPQQRYAVGMNRDLNEVNKQVKEIQKRISYLPEGTSSNARSIYTG